MSKKRGFRFEVLSPKLLLSGLVLLAVTGNWRPEAGLAQLPAGTPNYNVNAKWVTDRGSQVYNVEAYGATCNGTGTGDTAGIAAAITAAGNYGVILFPSGANCITTAQISLVGTGQVISGYGAKLTCNLASATDCIMFGTPGGTTNLEGFRDSIFGLQIIPGTNTSANAAIRDNGWWVRIQDVQGGSNSGYGFGHFIENDNDQGETIDHIFGFTGTVSCNATACGSILYAAPNASINAGITWVQNSDFSSNCTSNDIDWQGFNHLTISHSILQAWKQFALRTTSAVDIDGLTHMEDSPSCVNPLNDGSGHALGSASVIAVGGSVSAEGGGVGGAYGTVFSTNASGGSTEYAYYVVGHNAGGSVTAPLLAGYLTNGPATISGSAEVFLVWPALSNTGVTTWDILRTTGNPPYGTGNYAVTTALAASSACTASSGLVCAYTDSVGTPSSYTVATENLWPIDTFWPGNLVLFSNNATNSLNVASYSGPTVPSLLVNSSPNDKVVTHAKFTGIGNYYTGGVPTGPGFVSQASGYSPYSVPAPAQLILPGGVNYPTKGAINFGSYNLRAFDAMTLVDSNYPKTLADLMKHPTSDAADAALCIDNYTGACLRGPTISQYIGTLPDNSHFATRTTSTGIADAVPHFGFSTISTGAPSYPVLVDVSALTTCQTSTVYAFGSVCFDGTNFQMVQWPATGNAITSGATAPTWATTPGQTTVWGNITLICLGAGSLAANTQYYFKVAGCTIGGCSTASIEESITTANDGAAHMVIASGYGSIALLGATSYKVYCSTTTGTEASLTAPYTGAYTGNGYYLPAMNCSGSDSPPASDQTGYASVAGLCFNGANCNTSWPVTGYATVDANGTAQTQRNTLNLIGSGATSVACADNSGSSRTDCTVSSSAAALSTSAGYRATTTGALGVDTNTNTWYMDVNGLSWPLCSPADFTCVSWTENWVEIENQGWTNSYTPMGFKNYQIASNASSPSVGALSVGYFDTTHDGVSIGVTTTTGTSGKGEALGGVGTAIPMPATNFLFRIRFNQPQASTDETNGEIFQVGLMYYFNLGTASSTPEMLGLGLDTTQGDTTWNFITGNGGASRTVHSAGVSLDNNFHTLTIFSTVAGEYVMFLDTGTAYCFTAAASGGCTAASEGTVTVVNSAHLPGNNSVSPAISDTMESTTSVLYNLGRVFLQRRNLTASP